MLDGMNKTIDSRMKSRRSPGAAVLLLLLAISLLLTGCQRNEPLPFQLTNISGHMPALDFKLVDDQGKAVSGADYHGRWSCCISATPTVRMSVH